MNDIVWGTVTKVIDNNKFEMNVTHRKDENKNDYADNEIIICLLYTSPSPRDGLLSRMPSSA